MKPLFLPKRWKLSVVLFSIAYIQATIALAVIAFSLAEKIIMHAQTGQPTCLYIYLYLRRAL